MNKEEEEEDNYSVDERENLVSTLGSRPNPIRIEKVPSTMMIIAKTITIIIIITITITITMLRIIEDPCTKKNADD